MSEERKVGLIGVGTMGSAMARSLLSESFDVIAFDVVGERAAALGEAGGRAAGSVAQVAHEADRILVSLPSAGALDDVAEELAASGRSGIVAAETSTLALADKERARDRLAAAGITLLDCTISGTGGQARARDIIFYASGPREAVAPFEPLFAAMGRGAPWVGEFGAGTKMKFVSNLLVAVHTMAAGEALNLAVHAGLDAAQTFDLLVAGAGTSRMLEVRGPLMVAGDYGGGSATVRILGKDARLIRDFAEDIDVPTPLLSVVASFFASARGQGRADADPAVLAAVLDSLSPATTPTEGVSE